MKCSLYNTFICKTSKVAKSTKKELFVVKLKVTPQAVEKLRYIKA